MNRMPLQMIGFVLDRAGQQTAATEFNLLPFRVHASNFNDSQAADFGKNFRKAQTTLRTRHRVADGLHSGLISTNGMKPLTSAGLPSSSSVEGRSGDAAHVDDRQLQRMAHLLRGEADAFVRIHRFEHVGDQSLDCRRDFFDPLPFFRRTGVPNLTTSNIIQIPLSDYGQALSKATRSLIFGLSPVRT